MTDINTIKNLFSVFHYLKEETWYMLGIGIVVYLIYILYLIAFERYYKTQNAHPETIAQVPSIGDILSHLRTDDILFFEHLSHIIRTHLEDTKLVAHATKKTKKDFSHEPIPEKLKDILDTCTYYEYTGQTADTTEKEQIMTEVKGIFMYL